MSPHSSQMKSKPLYTSLLVILLLVLFFGLGDSILYAKSGFKSWVPYLIIFLCIPLTLTKVLKTLDIRGKANLVFSFGSILLIGPLFGFWIEHLSKTELSKNGLETVGVVSEKWWSDSHRGADEWLLKCEFLVDGEVYETYTMEDEENQYKVGDKLTILYSPINPDNNTIVELE